MVDPKLDTMDVSAQILSIFRPLLSTPDNATALTVVAKLRTASPPPEILAATINIVAKLLIQSTDAHSTTRMDSTTSAASKNSLDILQKVLSLLQTPPIVPRKALYQAMDSKVLEVLYPEGKFVADEKRLRTRLWFTQTRFNLFREESEGYAKLIALIWDCTQRAYDPDETLEKCLSLMGRYGLDPNRIIEIILSAATEKVDDALSKTGGMPFVHSVPQPFALLLDQFPNDHVQAVIGAMARAYQEPVPKAKESEVLGDAYSAEIDSKAGKSLVTLVAVMISEGRVNVADVCDYLSPTDKTEFSTRFLQYEEETAQLSESISVSRLGSQKSDEDSFKTPRPKFGASDRDVFCHYKLMEKGPLHSFSSQKIDLIVTLVGLCRSKDALTAIFTLAVNDFHPDVAAHPLIAKPLVGIAEALLNPLLHSLFPSLYAEKSHVSNAIRNLGGKEKGYDIPIDTMEEFLSDDEEGPGAVVRQILKVLGPHARESIRLLQALCRLCKGRKDKHVVAIMREVVLPSASLVQSNAALADAIWDVLKDWPHALRWELYRHLETVTSTTCAAYGVVSSRASYEMRYVLKRLTADNQRQHTLTISKITHGQALAGFTAALDRIQGYPADVVTVSPVVEACRRCTDLAIDILLYLVLDRMADSRRSRLKGDGINTAQWYATLSLLLALCLRKLNVASQHVDGVMLFLYTMLVEEDEPLFIIALSDIIKCAADVEVDINLTSNQLAAHGGGSILMELVSGVWGKLHADPNLCGKVFDFRMERERKSAILALLESFERTEVHSFLAVAIAQLTRDALYHESIRTMPLKLGANIVDMSRSSLLQLSRFMDSRPSESKKDEELRERIWKPLRSIGLGAMVREMRVPPSSIVALMSPVLDFLREKDREISTVPTKSKPSGQNAAEVQSVSQGKAKSADATKETNSGTTGREKGQEIQNKVDSSSDDVDTDASAFKGFIEAMHERVEGTIPNGVLESFWFLKLSDIAVPTDLYNVEHRRMLAVRGVWEKELEVCRRRYHSDSDQFRRIDMELRQVRDYSLALQKEKQVVTGKSSRVLAYLKDQRAALCDTGEKSGSEDSKVQATHFFLQECVLPRSKVSKPDALFCSRFVQLLLELDIPAINFVAYFETLLQLVPIILRSCSENECLCFSLLVKDVISTLDTWRSNRDVFDSDDASSKVRGLREFPSRSDSAPMKHERFCRWLFDIHEKLSDGLHMVLSSNEYLYLRNSLSILNAVADVFPKIHEHAAKIEDRVTKLTKSNLEDIRLTATGVLARLRAGKAKRIPKFVFTLKRDNGDSTANPSKNNEPNTSHSLQESQRPNGKPKGITKPGTGSPDTDKSIAKNGAASSDKAAQSSQRGAIKNLPSQKSDKKLHTPPSPAKRSSTHRGSGVGSNSPKSASGAVKAENSVTEHPLNPKAKEFVPSDQHAASGENKRATKRPRPFPEEKGREAIKKESVFPSNNERNSSKNEGGPPLKKARGDDPSNVSNKEGEPASTSLAKNASSVGDASASQGSKKENLKVETGVEPAARAQQSSADDSVHSRGKKAEDVEAGAKSAATKSSIGNSQSEPQDSGRLKAGSTSQGGVKRDNVGRSRSPSQRRSSPRGRGIATSRQQLQNGRDFGNSRSEADRYQGQGDTAGELGRKNGRRNVTNNVVGRDVNQARDTAREGPIREHQGGRWREPGSTYDYGGGLDRRSNEGGEFRRSSSSGRLGEGGGVDYGRDYHADGHGTKRRRGMGPSRGQYGYENEDRRPPRARNDTDFDRSRDEGKADLDRRYNGQSPPPNWTDGRRHGEGSDSGRRQGDEDHVGWQVRNDWEYDGGGRPPARRDGREGDYFDRPRDDRYREGQRRDERRRRVVPRARRQGRNMRP